MKSILEAAIIFALVYLIFETRKTQSAGAGCGCGCGSSGGCASAGMIPSLPASSAVTAAQTSSINPNIPTAPFSTARVATPFIAPRLNVLSGPQKLAQLSSFQGRPVYLQ
jgi:hypothetical protein